VSLIPLSLFRRGEIGIEAGWGFSESTATVDGGVIVLRCSFAMTVLTLRLETDSPPSPTFAFNFGDLVVGTSTGEADAGVGRDEFEMRCGTSNEHSLGGEEGMIEIAGEGNGAGKGIGMRSVKIVAWVCSGEESTFGASKGSRESLG
jgi:hypothetical protein